MNQTTLWTASAVIVAIVADALFIWAWRWVNHQGNKSMRATISDPGMTALRMKIMQTIQRVPLPLIIVLVITTAYASQFMFDMGEQGRLAGMIIFAAVFPVTWLMAYLEQPPSEAHASEPAAASLPRAPAITWERLAEQPRRTFLGALALIAALFSASQSRFAENNLTAGVLWAIGVTLFLVACLPEIRLPHFAQLKENWRRPQLLTWMAVALMVVGAFARTYALDRNPLGVEQDEGQIGSEAYRLKDGEQLHLFGTAWFYDHPAIFSYLQLASINLFGENTAGMRMLSGIMGSLSLLFLYLLTRSMFGPGPALITGLLFAFAPYHLEFSRLGIHDMVVMQLFIPATLYFSYRGSQTGLFFNYAAAGVLMGIGLWLDYNNKIMLLVPMVGAIFIYWILLRPRAWRMEFSRLGVLLLGVVFVLLPLWSSLGYNGGLWLDPARGKFLFSPEHFAVAAQVYGTSNPLLVLANQVQRVLFGINHFGDVSFIQGGRVLLDSMSAVFFFIGLAYSIWRWKEPRYGLLVIALFVGMQMNIWSNNPPQAHRMTPVMLMAYLLASVGIVTIGRLLAMVTRWPPRYLGFLAVLLMGSVAYNNLNTYLSPQSERLAWLEATETGQAIREWSPDYDIYFVGAPYLYANGHGAILFGSRLQSLKVPTLEDARTVLPLPQPAVRDVAFIFSSGHTDQLDIVRQYYPHGKVEEWLHRDKRYLQAYLVTKQDINGAETQSSSQP